MTDGERVLVTRLDYLGDVVLSLPLVDAIARKHPGVEIDYLTRRPAADLLAGESRFSRVFTLERGASFATSLGLVASLRRRHYGAVIDLYSNPRSAWLTWSTGARVRVGGDRRGRRHLYTHPMNVTARAATEHHLHYGAPLGVEPVATPPRLEITGRERARAQATLQEAMGRNDAAGPLVGIHPGGKWSVKRWPTDSFAELIALLHSQLDARVIVFTGPGEEEHTRALADRTGANATILDVLPVREVAAVISELDAMVACDGGIMHVSVACATPTVGIFGSAEPDIWFPYESFGPYRASFLEMACRPCHQHECPLGHTDCLHRLSVDHVLADLGRVLEWGGESRAGE